MQATTATPSPKKATSWNKFVHNVKNTFNELSNSPKDRVEMTMRDRLNIYGREQVATLAIGVAALALSPVMIAVGAVVAAVGCLCSRDVAAVGGALALAGVGSAVIGVGSVVGAAVSTVAVPLGAALRKASGQNLHDIVSDKGRQVTTVAELNTPPVSQVVATDGVQARLEAIIAQAEAAQARAQGGSPSAVATAPTRGTAGGPLANLQTGKSPVGVRAVHVQGVQ